MTPAISVIIPTLNNATAIGTTLDAVGRIALDLEMIVVDGGSTDDTVGISQWCGARVITAAGTQREALLHTGALAAKADVLWFIGPDAQLPSNACERILDALADNMVAGGRFGANRFGWGDRASGLFIRRSVYERAGGFTGGQTFEERGLLKRAAAYGRFIVIRPEEGRAGHGRPLRWSQL